VADNGTLDGNHARSLQCDPANVKSLGGGSITEQPSKDNPCLQAVDYFLRALLRFYEVKWNADTKQSQLDSKAGRVILEDRFLNAIWPQVGEIRDLHFRPAHGTFFTAKNPLKLEERFPPPPSNKKKEKT
jgi:hypothetical protein